MMMLSLNTWFEKGMSFEEYRKSMEVNRDELSRVYEKVDFTEEDFQFFSNLANKKWRGIVLTADWCGDASFCVPIIQRIAEKSNMDLKFLIRDENLELMDQYLTNGTARSIPIFIFIDEAGNEQRVWGPRAEKVQEFLQTLLVNLPDKDAADFKDKQKEVFGQFKEKVTTDPDMWRVVIESVITRLK
ncbi:thioredoxin family protein [Peribacillus sp. NPDC096379]|uniref:thioredoxin family protein n=1 Tax=Peribacillus sp. NPDC096379 TaxID=3364393 RepID=UPI0037F6AB96